MSSDRPQLPGPVWDDAAGPLVRPYTLTGGRTAAARDDLTLITLVTTADPAGDTTALPPEQVEILRLCARPQAVAEIAALVDLPVSVTKILLGDLLAQARVTARPPITAARTTDAALLTKVRDGLRGI
jgi:hypothetical protein